MKPYRRFKLKFKKFKLWVGRAWIDRRVPPAEPLMVSKTPRFIFIRKDGKIGDYVVSSFVFRELKRHWPDAVIDVVAADKNRALFDQNPYVDHVHILNQRSVTAAFCCGRRLSQAQHYDVLIDPTEIVRSRDLMLIRSLNARLNVGFNKADFGLFNLSIPEQGQHMAAVYAEILNRLGVAAADCRYDLPSTDAVQVKVAAFLATLPAGPILALNLHGDGRRRQFTPERARVLIQTLRQLWPTHVLVILSQPRQQATIDQLCQACNSPMVRFLPDTLCIEENIELMRYSQGVISPDTAIVHIATALQRPLLSFYSHDALNFQRWHPNHPGKNQIIRYHDHIDHVDFDAIDPLLFHPAETP